MKKLTFFPKQVFFPETWIIILSVEIKGYLRYKIILCHKVAFDL